MSNQPIEVKFPHLPVQERRAKLISALQAAELAMRQARDAMEDGVQWSYDLGMVQVAALWDARKAELSRCISSVAVTTNDAQFFLSNETVAQVEAELAKAKAAPVPV